jgi:hypothetical protein
VNRDRSSIANLEKCLEAPPTKYGRPSLRETFDSLLFEPDLDLKVSLLVMIFSARVSVGNFSGPHVISFFFESMTLSMPRVPITTTDNLSKSRSLCRRV